MAKVYFAEVLGFCIIGNHFHILVRMETEQDNSDDEIRKRFEVYYGENEKREFSKEQISALKEK